MLARLPSPNRLAVFVSQEALQTAVDHADNHAALDLLQLMEISAEKASEGSAAGRQKGVTPTVATAPRNVGDRPQGGRKLVVDEGQCLSLLNCAASSESRRLAVAAWQLLKSSLAGGVPGGELCGLVGSQATTQY